MGTRVELRGPGCVDQGTRIRLGNEAMAVIRETESRYSTWLPDSPLSRLNQLRSQAIPKVNPELDRLFEELERVIELSLAWEGAFHPGLGRWILAGGAREGKAPEAARLKALGTPPRISALRRFPRGSRVKKALEDPRWVFEEGGFAKGLALDLAVKSFDLTASQCSVELNLGGQLIHRGPSPSRVHVASPTNRSEAWVEVTIHNESVATSGQSEQPGHILDPRTGLPTPRLGSATVLHASALMADIGATALAVLGPHATPWVDWLYLTPDGHAYAPVRLKGRLRPLRPLQWHWVD